MAINELDRDYLKLLHMCDVMEMIQAGQKSKDSTDAEKKRNVGGIVMQLEGEILDDKYTTGGKSLTRINASITAGCSYWKS